LLHPNIPKALHGVNPRSIYGNGWWDKQRKESYSKNNYCCWACGVHKTKAKYHNWLEAHEMYEYDFNNYTLTFNEVVALCHSCHGYIHSGRLMILRDKNIISKKMYEDIIRHGTKIAKRINYDNENVQRLLNEYDTSDYIERWQEWRMIIDGESYEPKFKTFNEWQDFYSTFDN
jgi:hypothetical protein